MRWTRAAIAAVGMLACQACGSEPTVPLEGRARDAGAPDAGAPDSGALPCAIEGREPAAAFELSPLDVTGSFDGPAAASMTADDVVTFAFESGRVVPVRLTGGPLALPLEERLSAHLELTGGEAPAVSIVLRVASGVDAGLLRFALWDTTGGLPDVRPHSVRYQPLTCGAAPAACGTQAPQVLVVGREVEEVRLSPLHQDSISAASAMNGDSFHLLASSCADAAPRVRGAIDEYHAPLTNACLAEGAPNTGEVGLAGQDADMIRRVLDGVATVSRTGPEAVSLRFEDGRATDLRVRGAAAEALPQGGRWRTHVSHFTNSQGTVAELVLRSPEGPEPGALRYAAWDTRGELPDVAPFAIEYRAESCGLVDDGRCTLTGPQSMIVRGGGIVTAISSERHGVVGTAVFTNGRSRYVARATCGEASTRTVGVLALP